MANNYQIQGNPLMSGFQSGSAIGGGLRTAFSDRPAAEEAMKQIEAGADPSATIQNLYATNPQAADMILKQVRNMQTVEANKLAKEQSQYNFDRQKQTDERRKKLVSEIGEDDPMYKFFAQDPETAGLIMRYRREKDAQTRTEIGAPLLGALNVQNPTAKRRLLDEAAEKMDRFSPTLAKELKGHDQYSDEQLDAFIGPLVQTLGNTGFIPQSPGQDKTANITDYEYYVKLVEDGKEEQAQRFANAANLNPRERVDLSVEEKRRKERTGQAVEREGEAIGKGLRQAGALGGITRSIELLDKVQTGGYASAKKFATDFLGTTPADEAEFAYLTGKTVLGQLKDTFGAQFTNEEAKRLERLEAGLGRSVEANKAILSRVKEMSIAAALRGYDAAMRQGDEWTAQGIAQQLESAGVEVPNQGGGQRQQNKTAEDYIREAQQGQ